MANRAVWNPWSRVRDFVEGEAAGGIVLMGAAVLALVVANSPFAPSYFSVLAAYVGPLSVSHWINDGLMAVFFLLVGLEIKREILDGELSSWPRRVLPGIGALGGMLVPALVYVAFNHDDARTLRGWAVPTATDIAFALGVLSLLGKRVPTSLKVFLAALAIIDDLGAVVIIAVFYTSGIALDWLGLGVAVLGVLVVLNRIKVRALWPYLVLGALLWVFVLKSGVHATLAGVALALTIPLYDPYGKPDDAPMEGSPLLRLEHALHRVVPFVVVPIFGFANAGVSFAGIGAGAWTDDLTLGVAFGLLAGKLVGVFGFGGMAIRAGFAQLPHGSTWTQFAGIALLCGIGFTMSLFIGLLAFDGHPQLQEEAKLGILLGSLAAGMAGTLLLRFAAPRPRS